MIAWEWVRKQVAPDDVIDAARSIRRVNQSQIVFNLTSNWVKPEVYLWWAKNALGRGAEEGWDTAAGLAKRAVCRQMDGILKHNHLGYFLGKNYKTKSELLAELKVPGLNVMRDTVIDPRNSIEHDYEIAVKEQAERAVEVAEMFLMATEKEASVPAIATLGWCADFSRQYCGEPGKEYDRYTFGLSHHHSPMLLIDYYATCPEILVICPKEESLSLCPLKDFKSDQAITLNRLMRDCSKPPYGLCSTYNRRAMGILREQLKL
jgi:hypothetical protein